MKMLIELSKNKGDSDWAASWDKFVAVAETPDEAIDNLLSFAEVRDNFAGPNQVTNTD